ncbi:serine hydrolase domain-containing protein [Streptomyces sp. BA2]|uniref:serine hydrolase domain-containing protein n=1 Tax=Streptomyces sp. BA2 TaxID=436595 RepID=UPI001327CF22|nr:serine hydrolase [Streptomyces sp. BA2]MWA07760.1 serine hydrolase [Streptomyces sp. BA2]
MTPSSSLRVFLGRHRRAVIAVPTALTVLIAGCWAATTVLSLPSPFSLIRLADTPPSQQGALFPARNVDASTKPAPAQKALQALPATVAWKDGRKDTRQFLTDTHTNAFLVLRDGQLTHEWYRDGVDAQTRHASWSTAKSVISLLIGQSIAEGRLHEDDLLVDLLPELKKGDAYDRISVRHLLDMSSGIDVSEEYSRIPLSGTPRMYLTTDLPNFIKDNRTLRFTPGSASDYRSVDTQLLGQILHRVEGKSVAALLQERLWQPMGAEADATWNLDSEGGVEKSFCCLNATARDFAKIGQLVLDNGRAGDRQVVSKAWIDRLSAPAATMADGWGYSAQWWHPSGATGDFSAVGIHGQYIYVNPAKRTVIVKLSDHGTQQDEQETIDAMRDLSQNLHH